MNIYEKKSRGWFCGRPVALICMAAVIVAAILTVMPALPAFAAEPRFTCTGRITEEGAGRGIGGVPVSDGATVVRASADGTYSLKTDDPSPVIFVTVPDGYVLDPDRFWRRVIFNDAQTAARADFALRSRPKADKFVFIQISDSHHAAGTHSVEDIAHFIQDVRAMKPAPAFVIATGDLAMGVDNLEDPTKAPPMYQGFVDVFKPLPCPLLKVIGNHDCAVSLPKGAAGRHKETYRKFFGPVNYSFDYGKVHFVVLDACIDNEKLDQLIDRAGKAPGKWLDGDYDVFDEKALAWLSNDLAMLPKDKPLAMFTHQPAADQKNFDRLCELLKGRNFKGAFAGHYHRNNTIQERTKGSLGPFVITGALYGGWGGKPCTDGTWRGYRVIVVNGDSVRSCYAAIDKPFQGALLNVNVVRRKGNPLSGKAEIVTQIFDPDHRLKGVFVRIDAEKEVPMTARPETDLWARWSAVVDTTEAVNGPHKLIVSPYTDKERFNYEFDVEVKN